MSNSKTKKTAYEQLRETILSTPESRDAYEKARQAHEVGDGIRKAREQIGISQTELARRMGTRQPVIARIELGGTNITIHMLSRIAKALDCKLNLSIDSNEIKVA